MLNRCMKRGRTIRDEEAVSHVVATIILVVISVAIAVAVAYWVLGLGATFTRHEILEVHLAHAERIAGGWRVTARLSNTGSAAATINMILINGRPIPQSLVIDGFHVRANETVPTNGIATLNPGESCTITIILDGALAGALGTTFVQNMKVEVVFCTAAGGNYPKVVVLP